MKKVILAAVFVPTIVICALFAFAYIKDELPNKLLAARTVHNAESRGAIVIQEGESRVIEGVPISFDLLPAFTGQLEFTINKEKVYVSDGGSLVINDKRYFIHGWGIGNSAWASLTP